MKNEDVKIGMRVMITIDDSFGHAPGTLCRVVSHDREITSSGLYHGLHANDVIFIHAAYEFEPVSTLREMIERVYAWLTRHVK